MTLLVLILCGALLALWWHASVEARDRANLAAHEACERAGVQLLDGTVSFKSLRLARDEHGALALRRTYVFDYSEDGASRRHGFVMLRGREVELVGLGPTLVQGRAA
jgi:hypothetical protein